MRTIADVLLSKRAFEMISRDVFRALYEHGAHRGLLREHNAMEYSEIYEREDLNTALYFAIKNNLIDVAREIEELGGQTVLTQFSDFTEHSISNDMAIYIMGRWEYEHLHLSDFIIRMERQILEYNAVLFRNDRLIGILGLNLEPEAMANITDTPYILEALIMRGDVELLRAIMAAHPELRGAVTRFLAYNFPEIGYSGRWEMYEFACEVALEGALFATEPDNHEGVASTINHLFFISALSEGHFDAVRRFMADERINFSYNNARRGTLLQLLGRSKYWREIMVEMREELSVATGMAFDITHLLVGALETRNTEFVNYLLEFGPIEGFRRDVLYAAIRSRCLRYVEVIAANRDFIPAAEFDATRNMFNDTVLHQNNIAIIRAFIEHGSVIKYNELMYNLIPGGRHLTENTVAFVLSNVVVNKKDIPSLYHTLTHLFSLREALATTNVYRLFYDIVFSKYIPQNKIDWRAIYDGHWRTAMGLRVWQVEFYIHSMGISQREMHTLLTDLMRYQLADDEAVIRAKKYIATGN